MPLIEPIVDLQAHHFPIVSLAFLESHLLTICDGGRVKQWARPGKYKQVEAAGVIPLFKPVTSLASINSDPSDLSPNNDQQPKKPEAAASE